MAGKAIAVGNGQPWVAVKVIPRREHDERSIQQLSNEIRILHEVVREHNHVMTLVSNTQDKDFDYIELEALCAGPLHRHLRAEDGTQMKLGKALFYCE